MPKESAVQIRVAGDSILKTMFQGREEKRRYHVNPSKAGWKEDGIVQRASEN